MIWVRSVNRIHEFPEDHWWEISGGGNLIICKHLEGTDRDVQVARFSCVDWVRRAEPGTQLLDDSENTDEPESDSVSGSPLASCGDNPAVI